MTDNRSALSTYVGDLSALPKATPADMPEAPRSGWFDTLLAGGRTTIDEQTLPQNARVIGGYQELAEQLQANGVPRDRMLSVPGVSMLETIISFGQADADSDYRSATLDRELVWDALTEQRARNPEKYKHLPATPEEYERWLLNRRGARQRDQATVAQGPMLAALAGAMGASLVDPVNLGAAIVVPGTLGSNVATRILSAGALNAGVEAAQTPTYIANKAKLGETVTDGEVALNIALAGVAGSGLQGAGELATAGAKRLATPAGQLAERARRLIGWDRMTPDERDAVRTLEREADIVVTSPFDGGIAADAHVERVAKGVKALRESAPVAAPPPPPPAGMARAELKRRIGRVESPSDTARNPNSSATGRYQFVENTWASYYRRTFGDTGESTAQIMAKRTDGAVQERVMDTLVADNAKALARIGAPETAGNLYLSHFAGQGGAAKILRAAPDTPIEQLLTREAIAANPFLRGKSAGDVVEWAHAKMGERPHDGPVLRRDDFDADEDFAAAQREVDAAEAALRAVDREVADLDGPFAGREPIAVEETRAIDPEIEPIGVDWEPLPERIVAVDDGGVRVVEPAESVLATGGTRRPTAAIERLQREPTLMDRQANVDTAAVDGEFLLGTATVAAKGEPGFHIEDSYGDGHVLHSVFRDGDGVAKGVVVYPATPLGREPVPGYSNARIVSYVDPAYRRQGIATRLYDRLRDAGHDVDELMGIDDLTPDGAAFTNARKRRLIDRPESGFVPERMGNEAPIVADVPFDPVRDRDVQIDSIDHDLRLLLAEAPEARFQIGEDGEARSLADILDDLDGDAAALDAARACL